MTTSTPDNPSAGDGVHRGSAGRLWLSRLARALLVLIVLGVAAALSSHWLRNKPTAQRRPRRPEAMLVEVSRVTPATEQVTVRALGTVVPARLVDLSARVSGEIVGISPQFLPGGQLSAGKEVVRIDPEDYALAVQQQQAELDRLTAVLDQQRSNVARQVSEVARAESELKVERGQQSVAQREYELLGTVVEEEDLELILRRPQLRTAQANYGAAKAAKLAAEAGTRAAGASRDAAAVALRKAELNVTRTTIRTPFNATVHDKFVDLGSQVSPGTKLAELAGTDDYWVEVALPLDQLQWIDIPEVNSSEGATVRVYHESAWGPGAFRVGTVRRLMTELEPQGRMAQLLVSVKDPLALQAPAAERRPLILGAYVRVEIQGRALPDVVRVPRTAFHDGDRVWVMQPDGTLDIREVRPVWSGAEHVCVSQELSDGDLLVTSNLSAPVQGMALRRAGQPREEGPARSGGGERPGAKREDKR